MKNYLATKWKSLTAWSSVTWGQGRVGKAKVILAWYGLAVVVMAPVALLMAQQCGFDSFIMLNL